MTDDWEQIKTFPAPLPAYLFSVVSHQSPVVSRRRHPTGVQTWLEICKPIYLNLNRSEYSPDCFLPTRLPKGRVAPPYAVTCSDESAGLPKIRSLGSMRRYKSAPSRHKPLATRNGACQLTN